MIKTMMKGVIIDECEVNEDGVQQVGVLVLLKLISPT